MKLYKSNELQWPSARLRGGFMDGGESYLLALFSFILFALIIGSIDRDDINILDWL